MTKVRKNSPLNFLSLVFCVAMLAISSLAQNNKGSIIGTVRDQNDAVVPNAKVVVTSNSTRETREVTSNDGGDFAVTNLDPGVYQLSVESSGFKKIVFSKVTVETNSRVPVNAKFTELAGVGENVVTVEAEGGSLLESETSVRGDIISGREVVDLPIPQRNFTLLAGLSPGVTRPSGGSVGVIGGSNRVDSGAGNPSTESTRFRESGGSVISANGARVTQNNFSLDGVDNNESQFGQIAVYPNPDAIAEFKIETSVPSAESGRAGGAIISTTFKSGGNAVHGTLFENYQGRFLSAGASQFDENGSNRGRNPNFNTHNYGGTVGGPVFLPRFGEGGPWLYDGRNRTFFFVSVAGQRNATPAFGGTDFPLVTVPTVRQRAGDFSDLLAILPATGGCANPANAGSCQTFNLAGGGTVVAPRGTIFAPNGTPIPGNLLSNCPTCGAVSAFGRNLLNAYPLPTTSGLQNNYVRNRKEKSTVDSYDVKIDHKISNSNSIFGRYSKSRNSRIRDNNFPLGSSPNGNDLPSGFGAGDEFGNSRGITIGDTHSFTPTIINDFRAGWNNVRIGINNPGINGALGFNNNVSGSLGAPNINNCGTCGGIILLGIVDPSFSQEFVGDGGPFYFASHNYNLADTVTVVKGSSVFKFGADIRERRNTNFDGGRNGGIKGNYQYGTSVGGFASGGYPGIGAADTGSAVANLLLGYQPGFVGRGTPGGPYTLKNEEIAFFVQDDWKVSSNLTINAGVRYDLFTAPVERFDRQSNFNPSTGNIDVAGPTAALGRDLANLDKNNFGPRIGFAYSGFSKSKKLVLRGGYGLVYTTDVSGVQPLTTNPGTGAANFQCQPITNPGGCPAGYPLGRNPFDRGIPFAPGSEQVAPRGSSFRAPTGGSVIYNNPNRVDAFVHQYNLTAQYEFAKNWLAEIAYVGSKSRNLLLVHNIGSNNDQGGPGSRQVTTIGQVIASDYTGKASYNALQTKLEKRFSKGLSILSNYTFAKAIDDTPGGFCIGGTGPTQCGPDNPLRPELDRGLSGLDVKHRFVFANVYDLPFGRGRSYLSDIPTGLDLLIGGWQLNNVITIQSGPVYNPTFRGARPNLIGDPTPTSAQRAQGILLNRAAFAAPTQLVFPSDVSNNNCYNIVNGVRTGLNFNCPTIGTLGRNTLRGDSQEYWDANIFKNFPVRSISDAFNIQFRVSAFNVLNHVNRGTPNGNIEDTNFGRDFSEQRRRQMEFGLKLIF